MQGLSQVQHTIPWLCFTKRDGESPNWKPPLDPFGLPISREICVHIFISLIWLISIVLVGTRWLFQPINQNNDHFVTVKWLQMFLVSSENCDQKQQFFIHIVGNLFLWFC
jgi:hypothetical protein